MARKPRIHYPGAIYHVIARGNNRELVFRGIGDRYKYLNLLAKYLPKYNVELFCYVLMDNHVHLLAQVNDQPLPLLMQGVQQSYTQYFNRKYEHVGHVFQQRYKALLCTDDAYLITLLCYIHQNPVRAGLPGGIDSPWSSHRAYIGKPNPLVNVDFIFNQLHDNRQAAIHKYLELMGNDIDNLDWATDINTKHRVQDDREPVTIKPVEEQKIGQHITWEHMVELIANECGVDKDKLLQPCRTRNVVAARKRLICEAINRNLCSRNELAERLNLDISRITQVYRRGY